MKKERGLRKHIFVQEPSSEPSHRVQDEERKEHEAVYLSPMFSRHQIRPERRRSNRDQGRYYPIKQEAEIEPK